MYYNGKTARNLFGYDARAYYVQQHIKGEVKGVVIEELKETVSHIQPILFKIKQWRYSAYEWINTYYPKPIKQYLTVLVLGYHDNDFFEQRQMYQAFY